MTIESKTTIQERSSAANEALAYTRASFGQLTAREEQLVLAAARVAYRWALREIVGHFAPRIPASVAGDSFASYICRSSS